MHGCLVVALGGGGAICPVLGVGVGRAGHFVGGWRIDGFGALFCWVYGLTEGGD